MHEDIAEIINLHVIRYYECRTAGGGTAHSLTLNLGGD